MPISFYYCAPENRNFKSFDTSETSACIAVCSVAKIASEIFLCYQSKHSHFLSSREEVSHFSIIKQQSVIFHALVLLARGK